MKDFADINNAVGTFPSVTAQDCSGPGETDGTALIADTMTDYFGFIQALMNEAGLTPDDAAEAYNDSQILDALKIVMSNVPVSIASGFPLLDITTRLPDWTFDDDDWRSEINSGELIFPINPPRITCDCDITVRVQPGTTRTGVNRISVGIYVNPPTTSKSLLGSLVYDDGTASVQNITVSLSGQAFSAANDYLVIVTAGNDGATNKDSCYFVDQDYSV